MVSAKQQSNSNQKLNNKKSKATTDCFALKHDNTGYNFFTRSNQTRKTSDLNSIFLTRSKNGLTRNLTQFFYRSTRSE